MIYFKVKQKTIDYPKLYQKNKAGVSPTSPPASLSLGKVDYRPPGGNVDVLIDWNIAKYCVVQVGRTPTQPLGDRLPTNYIKLAVLLLVRQY